MKNYTLIGHPLGHSMSPMIHDALFRLRGRDASYTLTDIAPEDLAPQADLLRGLDGFNVTIPHKINIIPMLDELHESAKLYNSVNCVRKVNGKLIGYNTDCDGFLSSTFGFPFDKRVLLVGCGGVGRMMAIEAALQGIARGNRVDLTIAYIPEAQMQAVDLQCEVRSIICNIANKSVRIVKTYELGGKFDVILNSSPVGMYPKTDACPVPDDVIADCEYVFDAVYNPTETQLLKKAREYGKTAKGGADMLVLQAVKAHEYWDGDTYTPGEIEPIIRDVEKAVSA